MAHKVTWRIIDCPDGRFAVIALLSSGAIHRCGGLLTVAEADEAVEMLQVLMEACGAQLVSGSSEDTGAGAVAVAGGADRRL